MSGLEVIALIYMCVTTVALAALGKPYLLELLAERRRQKKLARRREQRQWQRQMKQAERDNAAAIALAGKSRAK